MIDTAIRIVFLLLSWWVLTFVLAGIGSLVCHSLKLDWDFFEKPIPLVATAVLSFVVHYYVLVGFGQLPSLFSAAGGPSMARTVPEPALGLPSSGAGEPSGWLRFFSDQRNQFWIGIVLAIPMGIGTSLIASWIHDRIKAR